MKKILSILLAVALMAALCACGQEQKPAETTAPATQAPTEAPTEATQPQILTEEALAEALATTYAATLDGDISLTQEVLVGQGTLDGNGYTLTGPTRVEGKPETENAITVTGGTVRNVKVVGAYRGIGDSSAHRVNGNVRLNNVDVDSQVYVLNFGYGNSANGMYVEDSTLKGWTSYTKFVETIFTNCTFGWDSTGANGNLRPYNDTELVGCRFENKVEADGTVVPFNIKFKDGSDGVLLTLVDCYVGDTLITQENADQLLGLALYGNTLQIRNTSGS